MTKEADAVYYRRRAQQQLVIAGAASDAAVKAIHLDLASRYATLAERADRAVEGSADKKGLDDL